MSELHDVTDISPADMDCPLCRTSAVCEYRARRKARVGPCELWVPSSCCVISEFRGRWRFLSNMYSARVLYDGNTYPSVEHAYQAAKTLDPKMRRLIRNSSPARAKRLGRSAQLRDDWSAVRLSIMKALVRRKFMTHPELARQLLATGDAILIEGNWWNDRFWGMCRGAGENHLGQILMEVRQELSSASPAQMSELS